MSKHISVPVRWVAVEQSRHIEENALIHVGNEEAKFATMFRRKARRWTKWVVGLPSTHSTLDREIGRFWEESDAKAAAEKELGVKE